MDDLDTARWIREDDFLNWFESTTGTTFPFTAVGKTLRQIGPQIWSTEEVPSSAVSGLPHTMQLNSANIRNYRIIGFWGHGINSYAIYYTVVEPGIEVHLRCLFGGAYCNAEVCSRDLIREILKAEELIDKCRSLGKRLKVSSNMGQWREEIS